MCVLFYYGFERGQIRIEGKNIQCPKYYYVIKDSTLITEIYLFPDIRIREYPDSWMWL